MKTINAGDEVRIMVAIDSYLFDDNPNWVHATFTDIHGCNHEFEDKISMFTIAHIDSTTPLPLLGVVGGVVLEVGEIVGNIVIKVTTDHPWAMKSIKAQSIFSVFASQVRFNEDIPDHLFHLPPQNQYL
jgi:hypothetical protein